MTNCTVDVGANHPGLAERARRAWRVFRPVPVKAAVWYMGELRPDGTWDPGPVIVAAGPDGAIRVDAGGQMVLGPGVVIRSRPSGGFEIEMPADGT